MIDLSHVDQSTYAAARPFPHAVVKNAVAEPLYLETAVSQIKTLPDTGWKEYQANKRGFTALQEQGGALAKLAKWFTSVEWLGQLERLTGVGPLVTDPTFGGGGVHKVMPGGSLGRHVDFNRLGDLYRRVNCLLYLNKDWQDDWKGDLELHGPDDKVKVSPEFNTLVVFTCSEQSWHGHPYRLSSPRPRLSFAAYYYTVDKPEWYTTKHSTIYRDRK